MEDGFFFCGCRPWPEMGDAPDTGRVRGVWVNSLPRKATAGEPRHPTPAATGCKPPLDTRKARSSAAPGCDPCPGQPNSPVFPRLLIGSAGGAPPLRVGPGRPLSEDEWELALNDRIVRCRTLALVDGPGSAAFQRLVRKAGGDPAWKPAVTSCTELNRAWCRAFGSVIGAHVVRWAEYQYRCLMDARRREGGAS